MLDLEVPWAVVLEEASGVYAGTGGLSIDDFVTYYVETGHALREWVQLWAVAQQTLLAWAEGYERCTPEGPGP